MSQHGLIEIDAAQALHSLRCTDQLEAFRGVADYGGVERASPEVVDRDHFAAVDSLLLGVGDCRGLRLGDEPHTVQVEPSKLRGFAEQPPFVLAVVGRVGQRDRGW